ncbi:hypothetical protein BDZ91DRAFT_760389 [Kalaharituber pfeilii]|nr:hypothetical protein BDZ91DRAFT_760389 [Kalaharituber pfeilii]
MTFDLVPGQRASGRRYAEGANAVADPVNWYHGDNEPMHCLLGDGDVDGEDGTGVAEKRWLCVPAPAVVVAPQTSTAPAALNWTNDLPRVPLAAGADTAAGAAGAAGAGAASIRLGARRRPPEASAEFTAAVETSPTDAVPPSRCCFSSDGRAGAVQAGAGWCWCWLGKGRGCCGCWEYCGSGSDGDGAGGDVSRGGRDGGGGVVVAQERGACIGVSGQTGARRRDRQRKQRACRGLASINRRTASSESLSNRSGENESGETGWERRNAVKARKALEFRVRSRETCHEHSQNVPPKAGWYTCGCSIPSYSAFMKDAPTILWVGGRSTGGGGRDPTASPTAGSSTSTLRFRSSVGFYQEPIWTVGNENWPAQFNS